MKGWKVIHRAENGDFQSCRINKDWLGAARSGWSVTYKPGIRTTGHSGTPLLAFRTRDAARSFKYMDDRVFRAELENPQPQSRLTHWLEPQTFASFWGGKSVKDFCAPDGTLACDAITLLEPA